jgi:hypothetical protein
MGTSAKIEATVETEATAIAPITAPIASNEITGTLSDGRNFIAQRAKTKDLLKAQRQAGLKDPIMTVYYLIADLVTIEGSPLTCEELLEMDMEDFEILSSATSEKKGKKPGE